MIVLLRRYISAKILSDQMIESLENVKKLNSGAGGNKTINAKCRFLLPELKELNELLEEKILAICTACDNKLAAEFEEKLIDESFSLLDDLK